MSLTPVRFGFVAALALFTALAGRLAAQNVLYVEHDGKARPVVRARFHTPYVEVDGKRVVADGHRFALQKAPEYLPYFIAVRDLEVKTFHLEMEGSELNHEFRIRGWLETPYHLEDVFIVLELFTETQGKVLFLQEVGELEAREPKLVEAAVAMSSGLGEGKYKFHIFTGGLEVLHSNIPPEVRDAALDRMTRKRLVGLPDGPPKPFAGPVPEYPKALLKAKTKGDAVITLRIGANGRVYDPKIKSATDPAFGESALVAVRLWRFLPRMVNGKAVEVTVDLPLDFTPPEKPEKKS